MSDPKSATATQEVAEVIEQTKSDLNSYDILSAESSDLGISYVLNTHILDNPGPRTLAGTLEVSIPKSLLVTGDVVNMGWSIVPASSPDTNGDGINIYVVQGEEVGKAVAGDWKWNNFATEGSPVFTPSVEGEQQANIWPLEVEGSSVWEGSREKSKVRCDEEVCNFEAYFDRAFIPEPIDQPLDWNTITFTPGEPV